MKKKVAIVQSNYIPWKGYFDLIRSVDCFVLYDEVQYTKRDFRNRNTIKTPQGLHWLSIPVQSKGKYHQKICDTKTQDSEWIVNHLKSLQQNYSKAKYFNEIFTLLEPIYNSLKNEESISKINFSFLKFILNFLNCKTELLWSMDIPKTVEDRNERLIEIIQHLNGGLYLSGPSAKTYMSAELFASKEIIICYADYSGYPPYTQLHGEFAHNVSILDLLFNEGPNSVNYMKRMISNEPT